MIRGSAHHDPEDLGELVVMGRGELWGERRSENENAERMLSCVLGKFRALAPPRVSPTWGVIRGHRPSCYAAV